MTNILVLTPTPFDVLHTLIVDIFIAYSPFNYNLKGAKDYSRYREACAPIRDDVENWLTAAGISPDYFYLLVAESHCDGTLKSKAGAVGYWQMMPRTARKYGCDDPYDLECETKAAARYLKHLEEKCGVENVIYCWHDGGSNFLRRGEPTKGAAGLAWQFRYLMRTDNP